MSQAGNDGAFGMQDVKCELVRRTRGTARDGRRQMQWPDVVRLFAVGVIASRQAQHGNSVVIWRR